MIVVDTNIIISLHVQTERTAQALRTLQKNPYWMAPPLWQSEFRNVLAGYLRRSLLNLQDAKSIMQSAMLTMEGHEILPSSDLVLDLVSASGCSAHDCEFVALAKHLKVKLVTADHKILQCFPETAVALGVFSGLP